MDVSLILFIAIDCKWKEWGDWGQCKQACPDGSRTRTRTKSQHAQHGGRQCTEDPEEHTTCNRLSELENQIAQLEETNRLEEEQLHCDVTRCTATAYKTCGGGDLCGTKNGISCAHIPTGLGNTGCAGDPLAPVQGLNHEDPEDNFVWFEGLVEHRALFLDPRLTIYQHGWDQVENCPIGQPYTKK